MKRIMLTIVAVATMVLGLQAQSQLTTYDACDANLNNEVNVGDAEYVANHVLKQTAGQNVVTALQLSAVLQEINTQLNLLQELSSRLAAVEQKLGIETPDEEPADTHQYVDNDDELRRKERERLQGIEQE